MRKILMDDYRAYACGEDFTPAVNRALEDAGRGDVELVFSRGTYRFYPGRAASHFCAVSNNSTGDRQVLFPLVGTHNLTVDGGGSDFLFYGELSPFVCDGASHICLKNFSVDYPYPFHTEGRVTAVGEGYYDLEIDTEQFPYRVEAGELKPYRPFWDRHPGESVLLTEFDPVTGGMAYGHPYVVRRMGKQADGETIAVEELAPGRVRVQGGEQTPPCPGNVMTFLNSGRNACVVFLNRSEDITVENVRMYHCSGMGVIAQMSRDITLNQVRAVVRPGSGRMVSLASDATHFVHCGGVIRLEDCVFESMLDDAGNFHGVYTPAEEAVEPNLLKIRYPHGRIDCYLPGDRVQLTDMRRMQSVWEGVIREVRDLDRQYTLLRFDIPLPPVEGLAATNLTRQPDQVIITGCRTGKNRPRGFLLTCRGRVRVEKNVFYNSDCGIEMAGDANDWYESGPVEDVLIRDNTFQDCGYAWGCPAIHINPAIPLGDAPYHGKVVITDNRFVTFNRWLLAAHHVANITFTDNTFTSTGTYRPLTDRLHVELRDCSGRVEVPGAKIY